jgi:hypothetical protein
VAGGVKFVEAKRLHYLDLVLRHGAERIAGMVVAAGRLFGIAIAAQIGGHHSEFARQGGRHLQPGQMVERIAVHQQQRRPTAAGNGNDARAAGLDLGTLKTFQHSRFLNIPPACLFTGQRSKITPSEGTSTQS